MRSKMSWPVDNKGYVKVELLKLADGSTAARLTREDGTSWTGRNLTTVDVQWAKNWCEQNKVKFEACPNI